MAVFRSLRAHCRLNMPNFEKRVKLVNFKKFGDTTDALEAANALVEGRCGKALRKFLKKSVSETEEKLAVADAKLGGIIKEMSAMSLGLAHSLTRYKLKFNPEKIDTMIVQAVSLLDDLDKELNNYCMRLREWYGWHFPEMAKYITDHVVYAKVVKTVGLRHNTATTDLSEILPEDLEKTIKEQAEISMGTEISDLDMLNIRQLCEQVLEISQYRGQLYEYLKNRMMALAPNLTAIVGELIGARLISHAGSLINLAKYPASTVQILGAEKALFRALKTKKDTPKYGLIYHATLISQQQGKMKAKMSRMLAAKAALSCRVDAFGEDNETELGVEHRAYLETRIKALQEAGLSRVSGTGKARAKQESYTFKSDVMPYDAAADSTLPKGKKRKLDEDEEETPATPLQESEEQPKKKKKKSKEVKTEVPDEAEEAEVNGATEEAGAEPAKKKKKKKAKKVKEEPEESD